MATAGTSVLAGYCGLYVAVLPLLALAALQALWVPLAGTLRHRAEFRSWWSDCWSIHDAHEHSGIHTVPLGLAVIAGGLAALSAGGSAAWLSTLTGICLGLAWLLTVIYVGQFLWSLASRGFLLEKLDGAWFLVPAALLATGMATVKSAVLVSSDAAALDLLALGIVLLGWLGYWAVMVAAFVRIRRFGLGGVPQSPWWIAMGCAGLAAAALGRVIQSSMPGSLLHAFLVVAMLVTAIFAVVLCVPVIVVATKFLFMHCRYCETAPWPPTFSTAVFALGCLGAGEVLHSPIFQILGLAAAYATLVFWAVTAGWNMKCACVARLRNRTHA